MDKVANLPERLGSVDIVDLRAIDLSRPEGEDMTLDALLYEVPQPPLSMHVRRIGEIDHLHAMILTRPPQTSLRRVLGKRCRGRTEQRASDAKRRPATTHNHCDYSPGKAGPMLSTDAFQAK